MAKFRAHMSLMIQFEDTHDRDKTDFQLYMQTRNGQMIFLSVIAPLYIIFKALLQTAA